MKKLLTNVKRNMSAEEKYEIFQNNKKEFESCFSKTNSYWGIDKIVLKGSNICIHSQGQIEKFKIESEGMDVRINYDSRGNISEIFITSTEFGKLYIGKNKFTGDYYYSLDLIHGGVNVETLSIEMIKERVRNILNEISDLTSIEFKDLSLKISEIELSWTVATTEELQLQVCSLLFRCMTRKKINFSSTKGSLKNKGYNILSTSAYKNNKQVIYNKVDKAIKNRQLEGKLDFEVFRYETVLKKDKILKSLGTNVLNLISDKKIIQYLESCVSFAVINLINEIENSVKRTDKVLLEISKNNIRRSFPFVLATHINYAHQTNMPLILDEEILSFLNLRYITSKNRSKARKNLIKNCRLLSLNDKQAFYLTEMVSWQTLLLFKLMFESLEYAKLKGLGCHKNTDETKLHIFKMTHFDIESRDRVYRFNNKSRTKNHSKIDLYKLVLERLVCKDRDIF